MNHAPQYVIDELKRIDPRLRIRWSKQFKRFSLERKVPSEHRDNLPLPTKYVMRNGRREEVVLPRDSDLSILWHDGYIKIMSLGTVDSFLPQMLRMQDAHRLGTHGTIKRLNEAELKQEELEKRRDKDMLQDMCGEMYDHLAHKQGERMAQVGGLGGN